MTIFGNLFGGDLIDSALLDALNEWMPTYLRAVAKDRDIDELAAPRSIVAVSELVRFPEQQLPAVVIVNPGTDSSPTRRPGHYDAKWPVDLCVEVSAATQSETRRNAQLYLIAARESILKARSLGQGMKGADWGGEDYTVVESGKRRSLGGARASFVIERENVAQIGGGPKDPDAEPYRDWPEVETVEVAVDKDN